MADKPDFALIGEKMAEVLLKAADDALLEAENLAERTKILAEGIKAQLEEHSIRLADINKRVEALRQNVQSSHEKFIDGK
jgi:hypothetical protein